MADAPHPSFFDTMFGRSPSVVTTGVLPATERAMGSSPPINVVARLSKAGGHTFEGVAPVAIDTTVAYTWTPPGSRVPYSAIVSAWGDVPDGGILWVTVDDGTGHLEGAPAGLPGPLGAAEATKERLLFGGTEATVYVYWTGPYDPGPLDVYVRVRATRYLG